jgi:hypothetical protein
MKTLLLSGLALLTCIFGGCLKNMLSDSQLAGTWQLTTTSGGFSGRTIYSSYSSPDSTYILSLQINHTYNRKLNGIVYESGTYNIMNLNSIADGKSMPAISFSGTSSLPRQVIQLNKDSLLLYENVYDGLEYKYLKIN